MAFHSILQQLYIETAVNFVPQLKTTFHDKNANNEFDFNEGNSLHKIMVNFTAK